MIKLDKKIDRDSYVIGNLYDIISIRVLGWWYIENIIMYLLRFQLVTLNNLSEPKIPTKTSDNIITHPISIFVVRFDAISKNTRHLVLVNNRDSSKTVCPMAAESSDGRTAAGTKASFTEVSGTAGDCTCLPRTAAGGTADSGRTVEGTDGVKPLAPTSRTARWITTATGWTVGRTAPARAVGRTARCIPATGRTADRMVAVKQYGRKTT